MMEFLTNKPAYLECLMDTEEKKALNLLSTSFLKYLYFPQFSLNFSKEFKKLYQNSHDNIEQLFSQLFSNTDKSLFDASDPLKESGTTACVCFIENSDGNFST